MFNLWPKGVAWLDQLIHEQRKQVPSALPSNPIEDPKWIEDLKAQKHNLLFYCGVEKRSESPAYTIERHTLWRHNETSAAIALKGAIQRDEIPLNIPREKVRGELLLLKDGAFDDLDSEMQRGVNFERRLTNILIPLIDWEGNPTRLVAWMYCGTDVLRDKITWDASFYRSSGGREFSLAKRMEDARRWIGKFYQHNNSDMNGATNKCYLYLHKGLNDPVPAAVQPADPPTVRIQVEQANSHK